MSTPHPLARPVGYAAVLAILIGLVLAAGLVVHEITHSRRIVRVHFPEIATLTAGDPVVQGGVPVGKVLAIRLPVNGSAGPGSNAETREAVVVIELYNHHPLAQDARFLNFSHSLMGARKVWIVPGVSPLPLDESRIQEGFFQPGLAETLHRVDSLVILIARLRAETDRLLTEDNPLKSPLAAARRLDEAARQLDQITGRLESARAALEAGLTGFSSAANQVRQGVRAAEPPLHASLQNARLLLTAVESVQKNLDTLLVRVEKITAMAGDSTGAGKLLNNGAAYDQLEKSVRLLEKTARFMTKEGLADSVKIKPRVRGR